MNVDVDAQIWIEFYYNSFINHIKCDWITFEATTKLRFPIGHGTSNQSFSKFSGISSIHSDIIS